MDVEVICHFLHRVSVNHLPSYRDLILRQGTWAADPLSALTGRRHPCARAFRDQCSLEFR